MAYQGGEDDVLNEKELIVERFKQFIKEFFSTDGERNYFPYRWATGPSRCPARSKPYVQQTAQLQAQATAVATRTSCAGPHVPALACTPAAAPVAAGSAAGATAGATIAAAGLAASAVAGNIHSSCSNCRANSSNTSNRGRANILVQQQRRSSRNQRPHTLPGHLSHSSASPNTPPPPDLPPGRRC